jgi:ribA/ribD-fused uncharacterized protein
MNRIDHFAYEYDFLSNFYPVPVMFDGMNFASVEHAYQAAKTTDPEKRLIFTSGFNPNLHPAQAKKIGRNLNIREDWEKIKVSVMRELLFKKFAIGELREKLLATGDAYLQEGNWWHDVFWGVCHHQMEGKTCREPEHKAYGGNHLGYLLMDVRAYYPPVL